MSHRVLIAGGGVAALEAALALRALAEERVSVELLAPELGSGTDPGPADTDKVRRLLDEIQAGKVRRVAFAIPWGAVWSLPAYELVLLTAAHLEARDV